MFMVDHLHDTAALFMNGFGDGVIFRMTAERLFLLIARFIINWKQDFSKL
jgi:hypothetical protein